MVCCMEAPNPYPSLAYCEAQERSAPAGQSPVYFSGIPGPCDLCGYPLELCEYFADAEVPALGRWAFTCFGCLAKHSVVFGWGIGQLYRQVSINPPQWLLVAGYPDEPLDDNT